MFETQDYKAIIKARAKQLKKTKTSFSLRKLAHRIPIQYTYLSKILNDDSTHLSEDQCFRAAMELGFESTEVDMLLLLRAFQSTKDEERRLRLQRKIDVIIKEQQLEVESASETQEAMKNELDFLLDPYCVVIKNALRLMKYQLHPRLLCVDLGITEGKLKSILKILEDNQLIETHPEDLFRITEVTKTQLHFGKNKPMMRTHQSMIKSVIPQKLNSIDEKDKHSFVATFTLSEQDFDLVKGEFQNFMKKVEKIFSNSTKENVYQLSFDFFKWL